MNKLAKIFLSVSTKRNVIGFSNTFQHNIYDRISQEKMDNIVIYVSKKLPVSQLAREDIVPRYFSPLFRKKIRFKLKEIGIISAPPSSADADAVVKAVDVDRTVRQDPVVLGLSIAHKAISAGSLGMKFVEMKSGDEVWGSNGHVLTPDAAMSPDDIEEKGIYQPGSYHCEPADETLVGIYRWHKQIVGVGSECPVTSAAIRLANAFSVLFDRHTKLQSVSSEGKNKIDFACYNATAPHECMLPDDLEIPGPFIGLLFAGSEQAGIICKAKNIRAEGYSSVEPEGEVEIDLAVSGSSFWGDYETVVEDPSMSVQVRYGNVTAMFEDLILVKNENVIKGGWSGSGWFLVDSKS